MRSWLDVILRNRLFIILLGVGTLFWGVKQYQNIPIDAFPDVTPNLVQIFVLVEELAPEEVEKYVTFPLEKAMNGLPHIEKVRSVSNFGLAVINIYFEDGVDIYFARQVVAERLNQVKEQVQFGHPQMGPITTGLGQVLFYYLEDTTGERSVRELRELQDWVIKYQLEMIPGVTEVLSLGGEVKQFQVRVHPLELMRLNISLGQVVDRIRNNNANIGAQYLVKNGEEYVIRSLGLMNKIQDLERTVIEAKNNVPVYLSDIADIEIGGEIRRGCMTKDGKGEIVGGMVLKLINTNTIKVIKQVEEKIKAINQSLPPGVRVVNYYSQEKIIEKCVSTVENSLLSSLVLVIIIILCFLRRVKSSIIVALSLPFSVAIAFILMKYTGLSANLMSLGGIVIAIGIMVDGTIIIIENIERVRLEKPNKNFLEVVKEAILEVVKPIIFATLSIITVFLPLGTLQGMEGKTFRPLALTVIFAVLGALIYALCITPVLASWWMNKSQKKEVKSKNKKRLIDRIIDQIYKPILTFFVRKKLILLGLVIGFIGIGVSAFKGLGSEFVPKLDEGDMLVRLTMAPSVSLEQAKEIVTVFEKRMLEDFPEVDQVVSRIGRGEIGAHSDPINSAEVFISLKPKEEWKHKGTTEQLYTIMGQHFSNFLGVQLNFTQPIAASVDELLTGTKAELAIKLFGPDISILKQKSKEIMKIVNQVEGATDIQKDQISGAPQLQLEINREAISRYGVNITDIQDIVQVAIGGKTAGKIYEGVKSFDIYVRYDKESRETIEAIKNVIMTCPTGEKVPLATFLEIKETMGARQITREGSQRFLTIQCNIRGRDIGSFVKEAKELIEQQVELPVGYFIEWGGQYELQQRANQRLFWIILITIGIILCLLLGHLRRYQDVIVIVSVLPIALIGGVLSLKLGAINLSVPASIGFIALLGVALQDGLVLIANFKRIVQSGIEPYEATIQSACTVFKPVCMTTITTALGLSPLLMSQGVGSEINKPLAVVVVGGLWTSTIVTLLVLPSVLHGFSRFSGSKRIK